MSSTMTVKSEEDRLYQLVDRYLNLPPEPSYLGLRGRLGRAIFRAVRRRRKEDSCLPNPDDIDYIGTNTPDPDSIEDFMLELSDILEKKRLHRYERPG